jgi:hypothetical protein
VVLGFRQLIFLAVLRFAEQHFIALPRKDVKAGFGFRATSYRLKERFSGRRDRDMLRLQFPTRGHCAHVVRTTVRLDPNAVPSVVYQHSKYSELCKGRFSWLASNPKNGLTAIVECDAAIPSRKHWSAKWQINRTSTW